VSTICPKCGHRRPARSTAPDWQCPACGIAYAKYAGYLEKRRTRPLPAALRRRPADTDVLAGWTRDSSLWSLVAVNALTLVLALVEGWALSSVLLVYWGQSVIIGLANVVRMISLDDFTTEGMRSNGRRLEATTQTQWSIALFFLLHYGMFHLIYLIFLVGQSIQDGRGSGFDLTFAVLMLAFAINHGFSLRYNIEVDRRGRPNLGTLMFTPYLRILPMHLVIIFGGLLPGSTWTLVLFIGLKSVADAAMHLVEHRHLSRAGRTDGT
jgi:hypothetical protein